MNKIRPYLFLLVLLSVYLIGCQSTSQPTPIPTSASPTITTVPPLASSADFSKEWLYNLTGWLELSYQEWEEYAGFGRVDEIYLRNPNLYATFGTLSILHETNQTIDNHDQIAAWINSLQTENGAYDDPLSNAPLLVETFWALQSLHYLNQAPSAPTAVTTFLRSCMIPNGLFIFDCGQGQTTGDEDAISTTYFAISSLDMLGAVNSFDLSSTQQELSAFVSAHLSDSTLTLADESTGLVISAITSLALINQNALPAGTTDWLTHKLSDINDLPSEFISVLKTRQLLEVVDLLNLPQIKDTETLSAWVEEKVLPLQSDNGGFGSNKTIDPVLTFEAMRVIHFCSLTYPDFAKLSTALTAHTLQGGWATFLSFDLSSEATFYAVTLAQQLAVMNTFNMTKIETFTFHILTTGEVPSGEDTSAATASDIYYALLTSQQLSRELTPDQTESVRTTLSQLELAASPVEIANFLWVTRQTGYEPSSTQLAVVDSAVNDVMTLHDQGQDTIQGLRMLYEGKKTLHLNQVSDDVIREGLLALQTTDGSFMRLSTTAKGDISATNIAISILHDMDAIKSADTAATRQFVQNSKLDTGIGYFPFDPAATEEFPGANLKSTYEGVAILNLLRTN